MEERSQELGGEIESARKDWERKRTDEKVPGANPPPSEEGPPPEASFPKKGGGQDEPPEQGPGDP